MCIPFDPADAYFAKSASIDEWTQRLNEKYGIAQPMAPEAEDTQPAPCSAATRAGERTP